ncbi:galectin-4-like [Discoglossus pictus]
MAGCAPIYNPTVPFQSAILGGISDGKRVTIQGQVHSHAKRIAVNFVCFNNDIAFHFNPRFDEGPVLVCNTQQQNKWGTEERKNHMPFQKNTYFDLNIIVLGHAFQVSVNGQFILEYRHRVSYQTIQSLHISGDVSLTTVIFSGQQAQMLPAPPPYSATPNFAQNMFAAHVVQSTMMQPVCQVPMNKRGPVTISNPVMPFQSVIQGNMTRNRNIIIVGTVPYGADKFKVDLVNSMTRNTYLHINPRFREGALVRNTQDRGNWGPEERAISYMPFAPGQGFQMEIRNEGSHFGVYVNGAKSFTYVHRLPPNQIDMIEVSGDVNLSYVKY